MPKTVIKEAKKATKDKKTTKTVLNNGGEIPKKCTTTNITSILAPDSLMHLDPIHIQRTVIHQTTNMRCIFPDGFLPRNRVDIQCWWCRHKFESAPIGIPTKYHQKQKTELSDNLMESVEMFETYGIFCTFPCALAYIMDNRKDQIFKDSVALLHLMYYRFFNKHIVIKKAIHWSMIKGNGGDRNINNFRTTYDEKVSLTNNIASLVFQIPIGRYVQIT